MKLPIEDKYFETTLEDGTIIYTRTRFIVEALLHYKHECEDFIENTEASFARAPRLMVLQSFEEVKAEINKVVDKRERLSKARELKDRIDGMLNNIFSNSKPQSETDNGYQKS